MDCWMETGDWQITRRLCNRRESDARASRETEQRGREGGSPATGKTGNHSLSALASGGGSSLCSGAGLFSGRGTGCLDMLSERPLGLQAHGGAECGARWGRR